MKLGHAKDILVSKLVTLPPHTDVFDAIPILLKHRITGAPVVDKTGQLLGVFSDKSCMNVMAAALGIPTEGTLPSPGSSRSDGPSHSQTHAVGGNFPQARDFMVTRLVTTPPHLDALEAISLLLKNHISGAPVLDGKQKLLGVFSERYAMKMLIGLAYDQFPTIDVSECMNTDLQRTISEDVDLPSMIRIFVDKYFRRLCVLRDDTLVGQISRRDVLRVGGKLLTDSTRGSIREYAKSHEDFRDTPADEVFMVSTFMNKEPRTIAEDTDFLSMAQIFLNTNNRRLEVVHDRKLIGQISRRDLLRAVYELIDVNPNPDSSLLYLSSLMDRGDTPVR